MFVQGDISVTEYFWYFSDTHEENVNFSVLRNLQRRFSCNLPYLKFQHNRTQQYKFEVRVALLGSGMVGWVHQTAVTYWGGRENNFESGNKCGMLWIPCSYVFWVDEY